MPHERGTELDKDALWFYAGSQNIDPELDSGAAALLTRAEVERLRDLLNAWLASPADAVADIRIADT